MVHMMPVDSDAQRIAKLRRFRNRPEPDLSLGFLKEHFKRRVERPAKQLQAIARLWQELLPPDLLAHTRLESLRGGVLKVSVHSSSHLYELDRRLREGLRQQLIGRHRGPAFRRIQLRVAPLENTSGPPRGRDSGDAPTSNESRY